MSSLSNLALQIPIENLLIPPSTYLTDRRVSDDIYAPYVTGKRAFGVSKPFPRDSTGRTRFPRVLRETTSFVLLEPNLLAEGIFRIPPNSKLRDVLKEAYDRSQKYIIWKDNGVTLPVPPYLSAQHQDEILAEVDPKDAYSVYMAAAMIKAWYASLRQPIFPTSSYVDLKRLYGNPQDIPDLDRLKDLFSPTSEWSLLPALSREIVVRHLLPLLSAVAACSEQNKMTAENLAVCFAPALLCGPDQLEDAKMSSIIRKIFTQAIDLWSQGLREACGQVAGNLETELKLPKDENDWEDSMEARSTVYAEPEEEQVQGITLQDNEQSPEYSEFGGSPPPLPPRAQTARLSTDSTKRKPAPPLPAPPRYSTVVTDSPGGVANSPANPTTTVGGAGTQSNTNNGQSASSPPRGNAVADERKSGTSNSVPVSASARYHVEDDSCPVSTFTSKLNLPKKKALTPAQIDNVVLAHNESKKQSDLDYSGTGAVQGGFALPGMGGRYNSNTGAKRVPSFTYTPGETSPPTATKGRSPSINSLARPVFPMIPRSMTDRPAPVSAKPSFSITTQNIRAPSPNIRQRMPSFETEKQKSDASCPVNRFLAPKKLDLQKQSVEDLRRLFEERADTASVLVEAGRLRNMTN